MLDLGTLQIGIEVDSSGAKNKIGEFKESVAAADAETKTGFIATIKELGTHLAGGLSNALGTAIGIVVQYKDAIYDAGKQVFDFVEGIASQGDVIDKQSQQLGLSAREYQTLAFAAEHSGFSIQTFTNAARQLNGTDFEGNLTGAIDSLMSIEDASERAAKAQELFGDRVAQTMMPLLNGQTSIADYEAQLDALGGFMDDDMVAASAAFEDSLTDIKMAFNGIKTQLGAVLMPIVQKALNFIISNVPVIREAFNSIMKLLSPFFDSIIKFGNALINFFAVVSNSANKQGTAIENVIVGIKSIIQAAVDFFSGVVEVITKIIEGDFSGAWELTIEIVEKVIGAIIKAFENFIAALVKAVVALGAKLFGAAKNAFQKLYDAAKEKVDSLKSWFSSAIGGIVDIVLGLKDKMFNAGKEIIDNLLQGFMQKWEAIVSWVNDKVGWISGRFKDADAAANVDGHHRVGLSEVPYDGYIAELHKGEMVLTAAEANQYSKHRFQSGDASTNTYLTVNNYSPKALDEAETARQYRKAQRELALGF